MGDGQTAAIEDLAAALGKRERLILALADVILGGEGTPEDFSRLVRILEDAGFDGTRVQAAKEGRG